MKKTMTMNRYHHHHIASSAVGRVATTDYSIIYHNRRLQLQLCDKILVCDPKPATSCLVSRSSRGSSRPSHLSRFPPLLFSFLLFSSLLFSSLFSSFLSSLPFSSLLISLLFLSLFSLLFFSLFSLLFFSLYSGDSSSLDPFPFLSFLFLFLLQEIGE